MLFTGMMASVQADIVSSLNISDNSAIGGIVLHGGSNIFSATSITVNPLISDLNATGFFMGIPTQNFGSVTFDPNNLSGESYGNAVTGYFTATSITEFNNPGILPNQVIFTIQGTFVPGTYTGGTPSTITGGSATVSYTFTQIGGVGTINSSGTMQVTSSVPVPEPSTVIMGLLVGTGLFPMIRRQLKKTV